MYRECSDSSIGLTIPPPGSDLSGGESLARTSGLALGGFALGVLSFVLWAWVRLPAPLVGLLAVILSWLALCQGNRTSSASLPAPRRPGRTLARWGLRLGVVMLVVFVGFLLVTGSLTGSAA